MSQRRRKLFRMHHDPNVIIPCGLKFRGTTADIDNLEDFTQLLHLWRRTTRVRPKHFINIIDRRIGLRYAYEFPSRSLPLFHHTDNSPGLRKPPIPGTGARSCHGESQQ